MSYRAELANFVTGDLEKDAEHASLVMTRLARKPSALSMWQQLCDDECGSCEQCVVAKAAVADALLRPDVRIWEVFEADEVAPIGILRLSRIRPGNAAVLDFSFFDNKIADKTRILENLVESSFADHNDWTALKRLTAEIPAHAFSLLRTFSKLGFGGPYPVRLGSAKVGVEAIVPTENEIVRDLVIMGKESG